MPEDSDLKTHALSTTHDFYDLLSIPDTAQAHEIRRAYRKTAPKYHPDKVGNDPAALEKFYLVQIAYDVLSEPAIRELYDNARRARLAKVERDQQFEGRRKAMKEDLERREKRGREEMEDEEAFARELRRLAEDGKRRRKEREEVLRREAEADREVEVAQEAEKNGNETSSSFKSKDQQGEEISDLDRSITLRYPQTPQTTHLTQTSLETLFTRFGAIDSLLLREKKLKPDGEKHRKLYTTAIIVFQSIVSAHAAVTDFPALAHAEPETFGLFEALGWAAGREPDCVPKIPGRDTAAAATSSSVPGPAGQAPIRFDPDRVKPAGAATGQSGSSTNGDGVKAPTFGSFKAGAAATGGPSLDEVTMMRLKNAERRRMEEKIRKEEAASSATASAAEVSE